MKHNGRSILRTTSILRAGKKKKNIIIEERVGFACKRGHHSTNCYKKKCTCPCHAQERREMVNP